MSEWSEQKNYKSADVIESVFLSDDVGEKKKLQNVHGWTDQQMEVYEYYTRMRIQLRAQADRDAQQRMATQPVATSREMYLGTYIEAMEPHVRDAVVVLNKNGYGTVSSGFYGRNTQQLVFERVDLGDWWFDDDFIQSMEARGVFFDRSRHDIFFEVTQMLSLDKLKEVWDDIAAQMPQCEGGAAMNVTPLAKAFRDAQMKLRNRLAAEGEL